MEAQVEINAQVVSYSLRDASDSVVYYDIAVTHVPLARCWRVQRRFKEFASLHGELTQLFSDVPALPSKSLWRRLDSDFLTQRKAFLDVFVRVLVKRPEAARCLQFRSFLELPKYAPEALPPALSLSTQSHIGAELFAATASEGCIAALAQSDSTFLRPKTPCACHFLTRESPALPFAVLWTQPLPLTPTALCWDPQLTLLAIGFETGLILVYRVYTELGCSKYSLFAKMQAHAAAVRGLALNYSNSHLYSIGDDHRFLVTEVTSGALMVDISLQAKALVFVAGTERVYIATAHEVVIFSVAIAEITATIAEKTKAAIRLVTVLPALSRLFAGTHTGIILVFRLGMLDCEQTSHEEAALRWKGKITAMAQSAQRSEVYAGNDEGLISIWNADQLELITVMKVDSEAVTGVMWSEAKLIVVGRGEKAIKDYEVPSRWRTEVRRKNGEVEALAETWKVTEDDLSGWDR